jgi:hypothetical protein
MAKKLKKLKPHPKRSIKGSDRSHPQGLWVDVKFFRKLTTRDPMLALSNEPSKLPLNRYLELADLILDSKPKKGPR